MNSTETEEPVKKDGRITKLYPYLKWGALTACLCILIGLGMKMKLFNANKDAANDAAVSNNSSASEETAVDSAFSVQNIPADKGFPDWGLTLSVKNVTSTGLTLVVTQSDGEPTGTLQTGDPYRLICLEDGTWKNVEELPLPEGVDARTWNSIAYPLPKSETREFEINWE